MEKAASGFAAAALASMTATCCSNPLEVAKCRLQLSATDPSFQALHADWIKAGRRVGMARVLVSMVRMEGAGALWAGLGASLLRSATYSAIRLSTYDWTYGSLESCWPGGGFATRVIAGATAGAVAAATANPVEVVKVRMQAFSTRQYASTLGAFVDIARQEGARGLWAGCGAHMQRSALWAAVQLSTYSQCKELLLQIPFLEQRGEGIATHVAASAVCGFLTVSAAHPFDLAKSRLMNQARTGGTYGGTLDCLRKTAREEGFLGLYRGWLPNYVRSGSHAVVLFVAFEQFRRLFGLEYMR